VYEFSTTLTVVQFLSSDNENPCVLESLLIDVSNIFRLDSHCDMSLSKWALTVASYQTVSHPVGWAYFLS
jgi:hypothetical protein